MNQREKDLETSKSEPHFYERTTGNCDAFADGATYARRQIVERLREWLESGGDDEMEELFAELEAP